MYSNGFGLQIDESLCSVHAVCETEEYWWKNQIFPQKKQAKIIFHLFGLGI